MSRVSRLAVGVPDASWLPSFQPLFAEGSINQREDRFADVWLKMGPRVGDVTD
jgi:hypothetical protein